MRYNYNDRYYDYVNNSALRSARVIILPLCNAFQIKSVLDVGCGEGAWLSVWRKFGIEDICGLDGDYVDRNRLLIDHASFNSIDLTQGFNLYRSFDLVQCLEVAEHLERSSSDRLV